VKILQREILFAGVAGLTATVAILSMSQLVASPKLLFGRSLSAIAPSLFPYITLALIILLSAALILLNLVRTRVTNSVPDQPDDAALDTNSSWLKTAAFFVLLTVYGLLLKPVGFLISSFLIISTISVMLGNRNWLQILLLAVFAPICLYLIATRAMLVSLPELNQIELGYASVVNWVTGLIAQ